MDSVRVSRAWDGPICRSEVVNTGSEPVRIKEVVLFDVPHDLPPDTALYGEGFQMLSQTGGNVGKPVDAHRGWRSGSDVSKYVPHP